jgi:hypothetical protein
VRALWRQDLARSPDEVGGDIAVWCSRRFALAVSGVLVASSVALSLWYGGPALSVHRLIGIGVLPLATMLLALAVTPPLS